MTLNSICLSVAQSRSSGELCVRGLKSKPKQSLEASICNIRIWKLDRWGWCPQKPAAWNHASTRSTVFWGRVNQCRLESTPLMVSVSWPPGTTHGRVGWDIISIVNCIDLKRWKNDFKIHLLIFPQMETEELIYPLGSLVAEFGGFDKIRYWFDEVTFSVSNRFSLFSFSIVLSPTDQNVFLLCISSSGNQIFCSSKYFLFSFFVFPP